jgi:hypothetical protein
MRRRRPDPVAVPVEAECGRHPRRPRTRRARPTTSSGRGAPGADLTACRQASDHGETIQGRDAGGEGALEHDHPPDRVAGRPVRSRRRARNATNATKTSPPPALPTRLVGTTVAMSSTRTRSTAVAATRCADAGACWPRSTRPQPPATGSARPRSLTRVAGSTMIPAGNPGARSARNRAGSDRRGGIPQHLPHVTADHVAAVATSATSPMAWRARSLAANLFAEGHYRVGTNRPASTRPHHRRRGLATRLRRRPANNNEFVNPVLGRPALVENLVWAANWVGSARTPSG